MSIMLTLLAISIATFVVYATYQHRVALRASATDDMKALAAAAEAEAKKVESKL